MRELNPTRNILSINDELAGCTHEFYYRMPTTAERIQYQAGLYQRKGNKVINKAYAQQIKFGQKMITGIKAGTLSYDGVALSSEAGTPGYREDWKTILETCAPELLALLARAIFESTSIGTGQTGLEMAIEDEDGNIVAEETPDLGK